MSKYKRLRPEDLVDALQDRIHPASGRLREARPVHRSMSDPTTLNGRLLIGAQRLGAREYAGVNAELLREAEARLRRYEEALRRFCGEALSDAEDTK